MTDTSTGTEVEKLVAELEAAGWHIDLDRYDDFDADGSNVGGFVVDAYRSPVAIRLNHPDAVTVLRMVLAAIHAAGEVS